MTLSTAGNPIQGLIQRIAGLAGNEEGGERIIGTRGENSLNLDPMLPIVVRILREMNLAENLQSGARFLDSNALTNVCLVSIKSIPYAFFSDSETVKKFDNGVSARLRFAEAGLMGFVSGAFNGGLALVFGVANLLTLTRVQAISNLWKKHSTNFCLSYASVAISFVGTIAPSFGVKANAAALLLIGFIALNFMQGDFVKTIAQAYQQNRDQIRGAIQQGLNHNPELFNDRIVPILDIVNREVDEGHIRNAQEIRALFQRSDFRLPNLQFYASSEVVQNNFHELIRGINISRESSAADSEQSAEST